MNPPTTARLRQLILALPLFAAASACAATPTEAESPAGEYVFVFLKTGPASDLTAEERQAAFQGHFANMGRMADAGQLLMAGPMGDPKPDPTHRGIWMFDTTEVEQALEWGRTDPTVELGVFVLEAHRFETGTHLERLLELDRQEEAERLADPETPDEWEGRGYLMASLAVDAPGGPEHLSDLADLSGIALAGRLRGADGEQTQPHRWLVWLTTSEETVARDLLPAGEAWTLHGWYGSKMVAEL